MEVCSLASGATLAEFDLADVEGKSIRALKSMLAAKLGVPRFRQRLFSDGSRQLEDDEICGADSMKLQVVLLEFGPCDEEEVEQMVSACRRDDAVALERLLQQPRDPNVENEDGYTPLHHAAYWGHVELARLLVEAGADIEYQKAAPETPLHFAAQEGQLDVVRLLLNLAADLEKITMDCRSTALHLAALGGHLDVARFLVEAGANKEAANWEANDNFRRLTPLHLAVEQGNLEIVRYLVKAGANKDRPTGDNGSTPLHLSVKNDARAISLFLLEAGANHHQPRWDDGFTALELAVERGQLDVVSRMLNESRGDTPMERLTYLASLRGHKKMVTLLADFQAKPPAKKLRIT